MKLVIAPDSFKESLDAGAVATAIASGFKAVLDDIEIDQIPIADGGEGTTQALVCATAGQLHWAQVTDPLGRSVNACWGLIQQAQQPATAIIEVAAASGLDKLSLAERNPLISSSRGTGELIRAALDQGVKRVILGLGGSATNDGGVGLLSALGVVFLDSQNNPLAEGGAALATLASIDPSGLDPRLRDVEFLIACDVDNPLLGERGASAVFGPQKGASRQDVVQLDQALQHYAQLSERLTGRFSRDCPGAGAAGGLGFGLMQFLDARLTPGIELILDAVDFDRRIQHADLVITGEGRIDGQTLSGKAPLGVAKRAKQAGIPVIAICGSRGAELDKIHQLGIDAVFSITPEPCSLATALEEAEQNLVSTSREIARLLTLNRR